jgi:3-hydroxyisobutyrate dehydrogenase-like beta-hydroxyacid dehydrogenase
MEVGFLGLGIMGKAMAINLLHHGFKVTVWNRTLSKVRWLPVLHDAIFLSWKISLIFHFPANCLPTVL